MLLKLLDNYGQQDIYNYNFAGYSGKFYINPENQQIILIDKKEEIKFEKINSTTWIANTLQFIARFKNSFTAICQALCLFSPNNFLKIRGRLRFLFPLQTPNNFVLEIDIPSPVPSDALVILGTYQKSNNDGIHRISLL